MIRAKIVTDKEYQKLKLPGLKELKVGRGLLRLSTETEKSNPNILRFLLGFILNVEFQGDRSLAAEKLEIYGGRYRTGNNDEGGARMTNKALGEILNDERKLMFWQLELFAEHLKVPTGALVLLSRCMSFIRDKEDEHATEFVKGVREMANVLDDVVSTKTLSEEHIDRMENCFAKALSKEQFFIWGGGDDQKD